MATTWTTTVVSGPIPVGTQWEVQVSHISSDPARTFTQSYQYTTDADLSTQVRTRLVKRDLEFDTPPSVPTIDLTEPTPEPPPMPTPDPYLPMSIGDIMGVPGVSAGILLESEVAAMRDRMSGALDALRRDIAMQDRPAVLHWAGLVAANPNAIIPPERYAEIVAYTQRPSASLP